jgi:hypothetical protein
MSGGPSQTDTFDMKPNHENGGEFSEISTNVPGVRFSELLPKLAQQADKLAIVRSLSTKEGDHGRGTYLMRTGHTASNRLSYPTIGSSISMQLATGADTVPNYISIAPYTSLNPAAYSPGFLGPKHAPLTIGSGNDGPADAPDGGYANLAVEDLAPPEGIDQALFNRRLGLWGTLQQEFASGYRHAAVDAHDTVYRRAQRLMNSEAAHTFDLSDEPDEVRQAYGRGRFGQSCLMARRWIEQGASFVEVSLGAGGGTPGWDTHSQNFPSVKTLSEQLDAGWATLMTDLDQRGLLESTTILWMGEFGRTPNINANAGRDHFPAAWTCVFAGGGIQGGQAYGRTSDDGTRVEENQVAAGDVLATLTAALGIPADTNLTSPSGRPISMVEGEPIVAIVAS